METKICITCKLDKPICEYSVRKENKDGYKGECKTCVKVRNAKFYINNRHNIEQWKPRNGKRGPKPKVKEENIDKPEEKQKQE